MVSDIEQAEEADTQRDDIAAVLVSVAVNCGDHAETIQTSVEVRPDETVRDLMERLIPVGSAWNPRKYDNWVRISFVQPAQREETGL